MKQITTKWLCLLLSFYASFGLAQVNVQDSLALVALYNATDGANWTNTWDLSQPVETWYGITMVSAQFVGEIDLRNNNLTGTIPTQIGDFTFLTKVYLFNNNLTGNIPVEISHLSGLEQLWLFGNSLTGTIPQQLGDLQNLTRLGLSSNNFTGNIPASIGDLSNLVAFGVQANQLEGCFDENLYSLCGQLTDYNIDTGNNFDALWDDFCNSQVGSCRMSDSLSLVAFYNATNGANWTISWDLSQPMNNWSGVTLDMRGRVKELKLSSRQMDSNIPPEIGNLTNLTYLDLRYNQLNGSIPAEIGNLNSLNVLYLNFNQLSTIPPEIGNLTNLIFLILSANQLSGNIPPEIGNLENLIFLDLDANQLSGNIPPEIENLDNLSELNLSNNNFSGNILIENLGNIGRLNLSSNQFNGNIPSEIGNLDNLSELNLSSNQLSGCYDENLINLCSNYYGNNYNINYGNNFDTPWEDFCNYGIGGCTTPDCSNDSLALVALYNSTNGAYWRNTWDLNQPMSTWHGVTSNVFGCVTKLYLYYNQLNGTIPPEIGNLDNLTELNLSSNQLNSTIPPEFGDLDNLTELDLRSNQLNGGIPPEIGNLDNLTELNLSSNQLNGTIPIEIENLSNLVSLNLGNNSLEGTIPSGIGNLNNLSWLYLWNNQLSGCYDENLSNLCGQIYSYHSSDYISDGNNFYSPWSYFCDIGAGVCNDIYSPCRESDSLSLVALYHATDGENWTHTWDLTQPINTWFGVAINDDGCVSHIYLSNNGLQGNIPSQLSNIDSLLSLNLSNNLLSGCYDVNLVNLCDGDMTVSHGNSFDASWDSFCTNNFGICSSRGNDSLSLVALYYATDGLNWTNTWDIHLPMDNWYGVHLNQYGRVEGLTLGSNNLNGTVPGRLNALTDLSYLSLHDNQLNGCYESELSNLCSQISLLYNSNDSISSGNNFEDTWENFCNQGAAMCPRSPRESDSLALVALYYSTKGEDWTRRWYISDPMDTWIGVELNSVGRVAKLSLTGNNLVGSIPPEVGNLSEITEINLYSEVYCEDVPGAGSWCYNIENNLSGSIPPEIGNLAKLTKLDLSINQLSGSIPTEFGNLNMLTHLNLSQNGISGSLPSAMSNWYFLQTIDVSYNNFTGQIPEFNSLLQNVNIISNKFPFDSVESLLNNFNIPQYYYSFQFHGNTQYKQVAVGEEEIELSQSLPGNNNQNVSYQWRKNNINLNETDSILTLTDIQPIDAGKYVLYMTDSTRVPELTIISEPIYVVVPGYDLYGERIEYNQLIIEFDDWQDKVNYENNQLFPKAAVLADSCSCNRLLYLWEFPNDSVAFQTLLDIDTKKQAQTADADVDGGFNNILGIGPIPGTQGWTWAGNYPHSYPDSVSIFLLDSGADVHNWDATPYLNNTAPIDDCYGIAPYSGYDYADNLTSVQPGYVDSIGHGTFGMRSIAEGMDDYMNMNVVPLKVFDKDGQGTLFNFICALYHAIDHDADIINVSAGYAGQPSDILEEAIALAHSKGQFVVTATGNEGANIDSIPQYPAYYAKPFFREVNGTNTLIHYDNVISVASINAMDSLWQYSNYGSESATISAYGENMGGYSHTGEEVSYSGTSLSTYYVTRQLAAEIARDKTRSFEDIWAAFETNYLRDCPATDGLTSTGKCLDISLREVYSDLRIFLEGAFDIAGDTMRTDLNTLRHVLSGQTDTTLNRATATHSYDIAPFDYYGTESVPLAFDDYPPEVVDWVLISARTEIDPISTVSRTAAWLLKDGRVQLLKPLFDELETAPDSVYIVVEHRNHMGIMSPEKLPVVRNLVEWDFTTQDSYKTATGTGQVMLDNLHWGMAAGDVNNDLDGYDINGADKGFWTDDNGKFKVYFPTDFNMDGDINGGDKIFWERNNGKFSNVPRY